LAEIRNPNASTPGTGGGGGDMRSTLAFMVLIGVALLAYQYFKPPVPTPEPQPQTQSASKPVPSAPVSQAAAPVAAQAGAAPAVVAAAETLTVVENELYKITFSNRGALVKQLDSEEIQRFARQSAGSGEPGRVGRLRLSPFALYVRAGADDGVEPGALPAFATGTVAAPAGIVFKYAKGPLTVTKTFAFNESAT
jgi:YidC/Oxa1 family membrane protein insertase